LFEQEAKAEVAERKRFQALKSMRDRKAIGVKGISERIKEGQTKELQIVIKSDVKGSLEALSESIKKLNNEHVAVKIIREGVGEISESDVMLASDAIVIGFRVGMSLSAQKAQEKTKVEVRLYDIIYEVLDDLKEALKDLLPKETVETEIGKAKILKIFKHGKKDMIVGAKLLSGKVNKEAEVLIKDSDVRATISGLKIVKDEVAEVSGDKEFGLNLKGLDSPEEGQELYFVIKEEKIKSL